MKKTIYFYYVENKISYYITLNSNQLKSQDYKLRRDKCCGYFVLTKGYTKDLQGLLKYRDDFMKRCKEMSEFNIPYKTSGSNRGAVLRMFKLKSTLALKKELKNMKMTVMPQVRRIENTYIQGCYNAGITFFDKSVAGKIQQYYGYDYSKFYPYVLSVSTPASYKCKFTIPLGRGILGHYTDFNKVKSKHRYGKYRIMIVCNHPEFNKVFKYSPKHTYTHYSIMTAYKYQKKYNITIQPLDTDKEHNYIYYPEKMLVEPCKIFGEWFNWIMSCSKKYPDNAFCKSLVSSLWGSLAQYKRIQVPEDKSEAYDWSDDITDDCEYYYLGTDDKFNEATGTITNNLILNDKNDPYKNNLARIKPYLISFCRKIIANIILDNGLGDKVVRIHTDGFTLTEPFDFSKLYPEYYPRNDEKHSGLFAYYSLVRTSKDDIDEDDKDKYSDENDDSDDDDDGAHLMSLSRANDDDEAT